MSAQNYFWSYCSSGKTQTCVENTCVSTQEKYQLRPSQQCWQKFFLDVLEETPNRSPGPAVTLLPSHVFLPGLCAAIRALEGKSKSLPLTSKPFPSSSSPLCKQGLFRGLEMRCVVSQLAFIAQSIRYVISQASWGWEGTLEIESLLQGEPTSKMCQIVHAVLLFP